jgi:hypothetical protein
VQAPTPEVAHPRTISSIALRTNSRPDTPSPSPQSILQKQLDRAGSCITVRNSSPTVDYGCTGNGCRDVWRKVGIEEDPAFVVQNTAFLSELVSCFATSSTNQRGSARFSVLHGDVWAPALQVLRTKRWLEHGVTSRGFPSTAPPRESRKCQSPDCAHQRMRRRIGGDPLRSPPAPCGSLSRARRMPDKTCQMRSEEIACAREMFPAQSFERRQIIRRYVGCGDHRHGRYDCRLTAVPLEACSPRSIDQSPIGDQPETFLRVPN